jgi:serine/threonine protein kinase
MLEAGKHLEHYRILQKIGKGGMGEVFLSQDTKIARCVCR